MMSVVFHCLYQAESTVYVVYSFFIQIKIDRRSDQFFLFFRSRERESVAVVSLRR